MAVSAMINTYTAIGNREELSNKIAELFADEVPFYAMCPKYKVGNRIVEWQADSLDSPATTGYIDGADISYTKPGARTKPRNTIQLFQRNWEVTHLQEATNTAGVTSDKARELMKAMKTLVRDVEKSILNSAASAVGSTASGATLKGLAKAVQTNTAVGTGSGNSASIALTEASFNARLQEIWDEGGNPRVTVVGGYQKRVISQNFTSNSKTSFNIESSARKAINNITDYEGSFGTVEVVPTRQALTTKVLIVDPDNVSIGVLTDIKQYEGAKTSSSHKGWVECAKTLNYGNEKAHGKISYLKTTGVL